MRFKPFSDRKIFSADREQLLTPLSKGDGGCVWEDPSSTQTSVKEFALTRRVFAKSGTYTGHGESHTQHTHTHTMLSLYLQAVKKALLETTHL